MLYNVEEDFDLGVAPKRAYFSSVTGGASRHLMVNGSSERMAIKVKCSNNRFFRISPVFTILEPGCAQRLQIVRDAGCPGMDKLVLLYTRTTGRNAREVFEQSRRPRRETSGTRHGWLWLKPNEPQSHAGQSHPGSGFVEMSVCWEEICDMRSAQHFEGVREVMENLVDAIDTHKAKL
uniref:Major sperm protein n=1 Tax=Globodera rostochiensis TaxID=31243 RepID=A0A914GUJ7_GLORO